MKTNILTLFIISFLTPCKMRAQIESTKYGTFVLGKPTIQLSCDRILRHIESASTCRFGGIGCPQRLNLKERAIFKAYVSAEDPLAELLQLAAQARMQNWHSNYHNAIGILIRCSKELNH